jgi:hypothetical protein
VTYLGASLVDYWAIHEILCPRFDVFTKMCLRIPFFWYMTLHRTKNEMNPKIFTPLLDPDDWLSCSQDPDNKRI